MNADAVMKMVVHSKYGCFWLRGDRKYAKRKEEPDILASVRSWTVEEVEREWIALEARDAEGR